MADATIHVVFRYDDLAADEPGERERNPDRRAIWEAEQAVDRLFAQAGLPWVAGVIPQANPAFLLKSTARQSVPFGADPEKVAFVKRSLAAGRMQVAVHGHTHTNYRSSRGKASEFCRSYDDQYRDLLTGRKILAEALGTGDFSTFIPPFNGWNKHTGPALVQSGFRLLSADRHQPGDTAAALIHVPFTAQLWEVEELLAQDRVPANSIVVTLFHPPQIARIPGHEHRYYGVERMTALLATLRANPAIKVVSLDGLQATRRDLTVSRYQAAAKLQRIRSLLHPALPVRRLPGEAQDKLYLSEAEYTQIYRPWVALTALVAVALFAGSFAAYGLVSSLLPPALSPVLAAGALLGFLGGIWLLRDISRRGFHPNSIRAGYVTITTAFLFAAIRHGWMLSAH